MCYAMGEVVFVLVCDFDLNLCEKKWRGLRYGNFHVGGVNLGNFVCCIKIFHLREIFVCLKSDWLVCLSGANFL